MEHHSLEIVVTFSGGNLPELLERASNALESIKDKCNNISLKKTESVTPNFAKFFIKEIPDPDKKLHAIKQVRETLGLSLKDAKMWVDGYISQMPLHQAKRANTTLTMLGFTCEVIPVFDRDDEEHNPPF